MTFPPPDDGIQTERCYRHPDRETLLHCGSCERPICTDCTVITPVGARCHECAGVPTGAARVVAGARSGAGISLTVALIVVNVVAFIFEYIRAGSGPINTQLLYDMGGMFGPAVADGQWWRLVTAGFLHGGTIHIALNMLALWFVGSALEDGIGSLPMAAVYLSSVLWGSAGAVLLDPMAVTVGASGGVFGLMGALVVVARQRGLHEMTRSVLVVVGLNLVFTFAVPGISVGGHIGGLLGGAAAAVVLMHGGRVRRVTAPATAAAVALLLAAAVAVGLYFASHPLDARVATVKGHGDTASLVAAPGVRHGDR